MAKPKHANALCNAAIEGKLDTVQQLLARGADPNGYNRHWTALSCAVMGGRTEVVRALLAAGAGPNGRDPEDGQTPLMHLIMTGSALDMLPLLISAGADPNARDDRGRTVLMWFVFPMQTSPALVKSLVEHGADIHAVDPFGVTARSYARNSRHHDLDEYFASLGVRAGVEHDLLNAASEGDLEGVEKALRAGANPNFSSSDQNVLYWACASGRAQIVQDLFDAGADPHARAFNGASPLFPAVDSGNTEIVRMLLDRGVSEEDGCLRDYTLLELAMSRENAEIVQLLGGDSKRMGLAYARGIASTDITEAAVLVRAESRAVADAFAAVRGLNVDHDLRKIKPIATDPAFAVFQLKGHGWTVIETMCVALTPELSSADARAVAEKMGTRAIFVAISDTAGSVEYVLYEGSAMLAQFAYDDSQALRELDGFRVASDFLKEQDAYLPGWNERARRVKPDRPVQLPPFKRSECAAVHVVQASRSLV